MPRASWRADPSAESYDDVRVSIVDAAEHLARRRGPDKLRVDEVAQTAGVSRATIYRYFANKDELLHGVLLRKAEEFADTLMGQLVELEDPGEMIVEGILNARDIVATDPFFEPFLNPTGAPTTRRLAGRSKGIRLIIAEGLAPAFELAEQVGILREGISAQDAADWTFMITFGFLTIPGAEERTREEESAYLRRMLLPSLLAVAPPLEP